MENVSVQDIVLATGGVLLSGDDGVMLNKIRLDSRQVETGDLFVPIVGDFYKGMATTVMLPGVDAHIVHNTLAEHYANQNFVTVAPIGGDENVIYANTMAGRDSLRLIVCGHEEQTIVTALFDNLGKGASGAAVQNMNIMLGLEETTGLTL